MNTETYNLLKSLKGILQYIEKKKPKDLNEAEHMLALIEIIASETLREHALDAAQPHAAQPHGAHR